MRFAGLDYLWLLAAVPVAALFLSWAFGLRRRALMKFADNELLLYLTDSVSEGKKRLKAFMLLAALLTMIIALVQPQWGYHFKEVKRRGLDIVIALDVSNSMLSQDIKPNRLETARREMKSLINMLQGDRIAIVAFAGESFLHCPLTLDYGTAKHFVDYLDTESIPVGGTDIGGAIMKAVKAYEGHEKKHRVLILITDGEDHLGGALEAAKEAKEHGIVIFPVSAGLKEGAPIPYMDENGRKSFIKDSSGNVVLSKADPVLLQKIALFTGGKKGTLGTGSFPLDKIYLEEVEKMEKKELESTRQKRYENRFQIFLFLSLILLVTESVLGERKREYKVS